MDENRPDPITVDEPRAAGPSAVQLPVNIRAVGQTHPGDIKVYIHEDAMKSILKYSSGDTTREVGGILVGDYAEAMGQVHVILSGYIEAQHTDASRASLTFTHATWDDIHRQHQQRYADSKLAGWHHTHPGYGIFLSSYDTFIQENFFNLPWQIAMVTDPKSGESGFFAWKSGRLEKLEGYYLYNDVGRAITLRERPPAHGAPAAKGRIRAVDIVLFLLILAVGGLGLWLNGGKAAPAAGENDRSIETLEERYSRLEDQYADLQDQYGDLKDENQNLEALIAGLQDTLSATAAPTPIPTAAPTPTPAPTADTLRFISHTVAPGESLSAICRQYGIDYESCRALILAVNGIGDEDRIYAGTVLALPITE